MSTSTTPPSASTTHRDDTASVHPLPRHVGAEVAIVGAGPAGAATALWAARAGFDTIILDMAAPGRDKTCGDGLTPRAVAALQEMGAADILDGHPHIDGLKLHGFGGSATAPWPAGGAFPTRGSAIARTDFDAALLARATRAGARLFSGVKITRATANPQAIESLHGRADNGALITVTAQHYVLAEGVRNTVGRHVGAHWLRDLVHGVAARSYIETPRGEEPWIHSHLELRDDAGVAQPGYGWIFPLGSDEHGTGRANLGCGALATSSRPVRFNTKKLLRTYAAQTRAEWDASEPQRIASALLPMGGAVSRVSGRNWAAVGDSAALVNPLNGEGIDYALESARMLVELLPDASRNPAGLAHMWPATLRSEYGSAFSLARRLAIVLTMPGLLSAIGPLGLRGPDALMNSAARLMGNLVTDQDKDTTARAWRAAGRLSARIDGWADSRPLFGQL